MGGCNASRVLFTWECVGDRFSQDGAALQEVIEKLAQNHISVTIGSASALAITVAVPRGHAQDGVKALHDAFFTPAIS